MGGAQMYVRNKILFLRSQGWDTDVLFYNEGEICIPELREYKQSRVPDLIKDIKVLSKRKVRNIVDSISEKYSNYDEIVIESNTYHLSFWGELLAEKTNGKHVIFIIEENFPRISLKEAEFFKFKLQRGELVMTSARVQQLLGSYYDDSLCIGKEAFELPSYTNVTSDDDIDVRYDANFPVILSIGRLDKPYIVPMIKSISEFAKNVEVNFFLVGDAAEKKYLDEVKSTLALAPKIHPYYFGYMYPIPTKLLKLADVVVASSGSVLVGYENGIPTIAIDGNDSDAIGVYGETTSNTLFRENESKITISSLLEDILVKHKYPKKEETLKYDFFKTNKIMLRHISIIKLSNPSMKYSNVLSLYSTKDKYLLSLKLFLVKILGEAITYKIKTMRNS